MLTLSDPICARTFQFKHCTCSNPLLNPFLQKPTKQFLPKFNFHPVLAVHNVEIIENLETKEKERPRIRWAELGPDVSEAQKLAISKLPKNMTNRCKALMKQLICFSPEKFSLPVLLAAWVKGMKPIRADWLAVLKELGNMDHPLYFQVAELALLEESLEPNVRDYTKIIHGYAKQNRLQDAEKILVDMKGRGFLCDQVTLTALIHMYSKAGNLKLAEDMFEEMKLLGLPLDKRSYGSMAMAYIRAGMLKQAESLLKEMDVLEVYAGREVYKALLRAYSMTGDCEGAQRTFDTTQFAGIVPDVKFCALLINAYVVAGRSCEACVAFENMRRAGLKPNDKCVALVLVAYQKENELKKGLNLLMDLEREGILIGKEASEILARWFRDLGVVEEVELVLREYASRYPVCNSVGVPWQLAQRTCIRKASATVRYPKNRGPLAVGTKNLHQKSISNCLFSKKPGSLGSWHKEPASEKHQQLFVLQKTVRKLNLLNKQIMP